jgi:hypothetical protein
VGNNVDTLGPFWAGLTMFNTDLFWNARWNELYLFLTSGSPSLLSLLLAVNTIFFIIYLIRRATQKHRMRASTVYFVQGMVVAANAFVLFREDALRYVMMMKGIL